MLLVIGTSALIIRHHQKQKIFREQRAHTHYPYIKDNQKDSNQEMKLMMKPSQWSSVALSLSCLTIFSCVALNRAQAARMESPLEEESSWLCCRDDNNVDCSCSDKMTHLPGWTNRQPLPSSWHSGFLDYELEGRIIHTHYVLVEAEGSPHKPLIYWSNGGPGASSLFGLMAELGPLLLSDLSTETQEYRETQIPSPQYNPYSWTKLGHILIFDQPAPVGFSHCELKNVTAAPSQRNVEQDNDVVDCAGLGWTDELAAQNTHAAMQAFYQQYPKLLQNDLYLTGESYAGIYIPTLAREIVKANEDTESDAPTMPLKGFAVGDGCLGTETGICQILDGDETSFDFWLVLFLAGHNQIPLHTFMEVMKACRLYEGSHAHFRNSDVCKAAVKKVHEQVGFVYDYSLYDDCTYSNGMMEKKRRQEFLKQKLTKSVQSSGEMSGELDLTGALNDYPCGGELVMEEYFKLDVVREAFHVQDADFFSADNANGFDYTPTEPDLTGFYTDIAKNTNLSVLVYNGDVDPAITSFATQNWTSHLGLHATQEWRPWTVDGCRRMGGYVQRYEGNLDFLTIRGAGHLVPMIKSAATFTFLSSWLSGKDYPAYVKNCTSPVPAHTNNMMTTMNHEQPTATSTVKTKFEPAQRGHVRAAA